MGLFSDDPNAVHEAAMDIDHGRTPRTALFHEEPAANLPAQNPGIPLWALLLAGLAIGAAAFFITLWMLDGVNS